MITAGIDVGTENTKIVILKDNQVLAREIAPSGGFRRTQAVEQVWQKALDQAQVPASEVATVVATGQGKFDVSMAKGDVVETLAEVKAALWLNPNARSLVTTGADQARAVKFDSQGRIVEYALNQKCTAGLGLFLEAQARLLDLTMEEMSELTAEGHGIAVNDQCGAYAGLDTVSLIHNNVPKGSIAQATHEAVATRLNSMVNEVDLEQEIMLLGGVARNKGVVTALKERMGIILTVAEFPEYAAALGAALIAAGR